MPNEEFTTKVVPRSDGRNVIDLIRVHGGAGRCPECGHQDDGDGRVAIMDMVLDGGQQVEVIVSVKPLGSGFLVRESGEWTDDPDGEMEVTPLAIVLDDNLASRIRPPAATVDVVELEEPKPEVLGTVAIPEDPKYDLPGSWGGPVDGGPIGG